MGDANVCRKCGAKLTKKQYGDSLKQMAIYAPVGMKWSGADRPRIEKAKGGIMWAVVRGPLCPACLAAWISGPK
jgi:hypothetical protein